MIKLKKLLTEAACGECFSFAFQKIKKAGPYARLVHCEIKPQYMPNYFPHAFYTAGNRVWDWQSHKSFSKEGAKAHIKMAGGSDPDKIFAKGWDKKEYYKLFKPKKIKEYDKDEAFLSMARNMHMGPWND